jgi:hypothetical protein
MSYLHAEDRPPQRTALLVGLLLCMSFFYIAPAEAAPYAYGRPGYGAECALGIQRSADPEAYYLEIRFGSAAAPDIALGVRGRLLRIQARQSADQREAGCQTRFYKSLTLPRDADATRIQRQDEAGRVLIVIPRREPYWR